MGVSSEYDRSGPAFDRIQTFSSLLNLVLDHPEGTDNEHLADRSCDYETTESALERSKSDLSQYERYFSYCSTAADTLAQRHCSTNSSARKVTKSAGHTPVERALCVLVYAQDRRQTRGQRDSLIEQKQVAAHPDRSPAAIERQNTVRQSAGRVSARRSLDRPNDH